MMASLTTIPHQHVIEEEPVVWRWGAPGSELKKLNMIHKIKIRLPNTSQPRFQPTIFCQLRQKLQIFKDVSLTFVVKTNLNFCWNCVVKQNDHLWQVEYDGVGHDWNNEGAGRELLPKGGNFILFCSVFGLIVLHSVCCWFLLFFYNISDLDRDWLIWKYLSERDQLFEAGSEAQLDIGGKTFL